MSLENYGEMRDEVLDARFQQQQRVVRSQISSLLTKSADWELPPGLLQRQAARELERAVMELRRIAFPLPQSAASDTPLLPLKAMLFPRIKFPIATGPLR